MMISPEAYYDNELQGKTPEEIRRKIRSLRREISTLKRTMENPDYSPTSCPGEDVRISCDRLYLERAKKALADMGVEYIPTASEKKDALFNDSLENAEEVKLEITDYLSGGHVYVVRMDDPVCCSHEVYGLCSPEVEPPADYDPVTKEEFIEYLSDIHLGEWRKHYTLDRFGVIMMDGTYWKLTITYKDGRKPFRCSGDNAYPYNFDKFCDLMGVELTPDEADEDEE